VTFSIQPSGAFALPYWISVRPEKNTNQYKAKKSEEKKTSLLLFFLNKWIKYLSR
jgi:hypothetical protein